MIDCLSGGQIDNLKHLLNLTTIEIIKKSVDQKLIAEMVFNLYLKFNYTPYNRNDDSLVKLYMTDIIHNIENDLHIFDDICKKCLYFLEGKELGDWKIKICSDRKILSKSINTFVIPLSLAIQSINVIKLYISVVRIFFRIQCNKTPDFC